MDALSRFSDKLRIPKYVEENAALIYRKVLEKGFIRGRSIKGSVAASLYAACRLTQTPRSLKKVVEVSGRSQKEISRLYRLIQQELNIKMPIDNPFKYVSKIASKLKLSQRTENLGVELLFKAQKNKSVVGKDPSGIAAASLYVASILNNEKIFQKELAKAAKVTEVTIRNRYKKLMIDLGLHS
jgi:transcription initiation factor TFIIB